MYGYADGYHQSHSVLHSKFESAPKAPLQRRFHTSNPSVGNDFKRDAQQCKIKLRFVITLPVITLYGIAEMF